MPSIKPPRPVRYHLRVGLQPQQFAAQARKLFQIVAEGGIDEVMFFAPHVEECSPGLGTAEECERMVELLRPLFRRCRRTGVTPSINIFWTMSFSNMPTLPRNQRKQFDFRWAVSMEGKVSNVVACPRCESWRRESRRVYATLARLEPARLWIDDDVRTTLKADLFSPCFCDVCMEDMARRTGRKWERMELNRAILADPENAADGVRTIWMEYQWEMMQEIFTGLSRAVHEVSPRTQMGLMLGGAETHFTEGRRYHRTIQCLESEHPIVRPNIGPYIEGTPIEVAEGLANCRRELALLPPGTSAAPEIENYPFSRFRKSVSLVRADMALGQLLGMHEATLNFYPMSGRIDLNADDVWAPTIRQDKRFLQAIADLDIGEGQHRGVTLPIHESISRYVRGAGEQPKPILMMRQRPWDSALPLMGIATAYRVNEAAAADPGPVIMLCAEQVLCLDDGELERVFAGGVVMDARGAEALVFRGRGRLAGIGPRIADTGASIETVEVKGFGAPVGTPDSIRYNAQIWQFKLHPKARVISRFRDYHRRETGHGVVLFENKLGGRTVVYPYDSQATAYQIGGGPTNPFFSATFLTWPRQAQLLSTIEWAGRRPVPLHIPGVPCAIPLLIEQENRLIVGVVNSHPDPVVSVVLRLATPRVPIRRVRHLRLNGTWAPCRARIGGPTRGTVTIDTGVRLDHHGVGVFILE